MNDDLLIIQLRDCFTAGYTLPQFCRDLNIKKPLFIAIDERRADFLWEIFVQFKFDKRITPKFALLNGKQITLNEKWIISGDLPKLKFENLSAINLNDHDAVIVLNAVRFNAPIPKIIYLDQLLNYFIVRTYAEIPLLHFMQRHPRVKLIITNYPGQPSIDDAEFNKKCIPIGELREKLEADNSGNVPTLFDWLGYTNEEVLKLIGTEKIKTNLDGSTSIEDSNDAIIGTKNGKRITPNQPKNYVNTIYFCGNCVVYGVNAPFDKTISSYLQRMLNEHNLPYRVENVSQTYFQRRQDMFYNLVKLNPKPDDIIFFFTHFSSKLPCINLGNAFDGYDPRKIWANQGHPNEIGYKILAEKFFNLLTQHNFFKDIQFNYQAPPPIHRYGIPKENSSPATNLFDIEELEAHKQKLRERRLKIGCLTINANPFHLGHEYLVQYAASRVHKLFILVDSEDKTEFSFVDRFELVKRGTEQFPNVEVLPSGKFFASMTTFSGYFNKENLQDVYVDSTENAEMFAAEIAPSLGITIKFDGEEPRDNVTRQYHDNLRTLLPRYGIEYCEIPRREINGEIISAKTVRAALKVGDFVKIKKLVPATTYKFLREKYFK